MKDSRKTKLLIFFIVGGILSAILYGCIICFTGVNGGSILVLGLMWVPTFAAMISKLVVDHSIKGIGWRIHLRTLPYIGLAYIIPIIACFIVYGFAWATGIGGIYEFSLQEYAIFAVVGVLMSSISAMGEEIGWRGFLLTELRGIYSFEKVSTVIGIIWFFYHVPLILFSDYNNGNKLVSTICFFFMVMGFTVIANQLCIRAKSLWPAVMIHASHNLFVQSIFDAITENKKYTQFVTSEFGIGLAIVYGVMAIIILMMNKKRKLVTPSK